MLRKRIILAAIIAVVLIGITLGIFFAMSGGGSQVAGDVKVPINITGASNVGSVALELVYDPGVLEAVDVKAGETAGNAMIEYDAETPGRIVIGIIASSGITGDGSLIMVGFDIIDEVGTTSLALVDVETHDATTLIDIINQASDGSFTAGGQLTEPVVRFGD